MSLAPSEAAILEVGEEECSKVAGALCTDTSRLGGVWMPPLLELGDRSTAPGEQCGTRGPGAPGHVVVTIEPGGVVTTTYTADVGHTVREGESGSVLDV